MAYTTINKSSEHFNTKLYTGDATTSHAITGVNFQPDMTWLKNRNTTNDHELFDAVRGATKTIYPNRSDAEYTNASGSLTSFNSDGFTVGNGDGANKSGSGIASWNWKANGAGSTNYDGSINSTVSVNQSAGFSIVTYSGNATTGATIGHGLNSVPKMIIVKSRTNGADWWGTYHHSLGNTKAVWINDNNIQQTRTYWNNTSPTSSVFTVSNERSVNGSGETFVAYCFAEKTGYSKFDSYTGNGNADGTFVYTGFKPAFIMLKNTETAGNNWVMIDNKRLGYNVDNNRIYADLSNAEDTTDVIDIVSNGFKHRFTGGTSNGSGDNYIYMAFAEAPLVGTNNVPCTAR